MPTETTIDPQFLSSILALDPSDAQRVLKAVEQYTTDPATPSLNLERLGGRAGNNRLWSIRASLELRVLLARQGPVSVLLRAGHHDAIYELADRTAFVTPVSGRPGLIGLRREAMDLSGPMAVSVSPAAAVPADDRAPSILEHWSTGELAEAGFDNADIDILREVTIDTLLDRWTDIDEETFSKVVELSELSPEEWRQRQLVEDEGAADERFRRAIVERGALAGLSSVLTPDEVRRLAAAPIEDWMIFLHPDQRALVDRRFNGPARVRGPAGTGKTVVALHRAAVLTKRFATEGAGSPSPILFTTFVKTLIPVFENLYRRLPAAEEGAVEFVNVDKLAYRICRELDQQPVLDFRKVDSTFAKAHKAVVGVGTPLHRAQLTRSYLRDEITAVMKGRGIDSLDEYLDMERTGRRTPFSAAMREQAWELREEWDRRLAEAGVVDFPDVIRQARDLARSQPAPMYSAAIVDESQDFTSVGLQLVQALVNGPTGTDRPDGLFIVGDGAQKIYPGGFTLAQAGVDVRGNSSVLRVNYRNTHQIIDAALACTGREAVDDLGDEYARGDAEVESRREGAKPFLVQVDDFDEQLAFVAHQVEQLCGDRALSPGDVAVFVSTNKLVKQAVAGLEADGLRCQELTDFRGLTKPLVKVGTFHRAKGLEFKVVFVLDLSADSFPSPRFTGQSEAEYADSRQLQISSLFVAMTRARDGLFVLCTGEPSDIVYGALDSFEIVEG